jgi:phage baseplate assembly protein W
MEDHKDFLGRGWAYPVAFDPTTASVAEAAYEQDIKQAIRIILETSPGERVMRPEFGCGIHRLVFTAIDSAALTRVEASVRDALTRYEARIELLEVSTDPLEAAEGKLLVNIHYRVRLTNQTANLVYPFYFQEGGRA